ncbi:MAG TPA: hypothetical protein G4N94_01980 [Caldilineae bacterium]|nr:hypothetical protein [Caldilineae bacterium]
MDVSYMLHEMCHNVLSAADIKAIGKSRGFSAKEIATPALLANFFLSPIGVQTALQSLSREEVAFLYFLKEHGQEIGIAPFSRIYGDASTGKKWYHGTFTQRYQHTLRQVKKALVRKGVLLMAEQVNGGDTKMERWRFRFPPEFEAFLPPLLFDAIALEAPGDYQEDVVRTKLLKITAGRSAKPTLDPIQYAWKFKDGALFMGLEPYSVQRLEAWQNACWQASIPGKKRVWSPQETASDKARVYTSIQATVYALAQLGPSEWASPQQLTPVFKVFCNRDALGEDVCEAGWRWGRLARQEVDGRMLYRLAPALSAPASELDPASYLRSPTGHFLEIDLETIPYQALAELNQLTHLEVIEQRLLAKPNFITAGRAPASVRNGPLAQWLRSNASGFKQMFEQLDKRWGKQIIHENLMLARVKDLSLKVRIEKSLGTKGVVSLSDEFIAFPVGLAPKVRRIVGQADFAVKEVSAS